ncbi:hypothetical protein ABZS66_37000 [Dactylosporangium sp. NPDC005572]|uniref:hypothetical protein n=1 Tax=Dactylosporangium sp. NPDC005572 TaxID=3156889 RepID=UPI00339F9554
MANSFTYTYSETRTRTEAVHDQFAMFLMYSGLPSYKHDNILKGIDNHWLDAVGVYLVSGGERVLEAEVKVDWKLHTDLVVISPTVRGNLPGWTEGAAPEIKAIGHRFGLRAQELDLVPRYWVQFTAQINADPALYRQRCADVGVNAGSSLPPWRSTPATRSYRVEDLQEISIDLRDAQ